jgi:enhancing lycopene biosynthesis protein 2
MQVHGRGGGALIVPGLVIAAVGVAAIATGGAMFLATRDPSRAPQSVPTAGPPYETAGVAPLPLPKVTGTRLVSLSC